MPNCSYLVLNRQRKMSTLHLPLFLCCIRLSPKLWKVQNFHEYWILKNVLASMADEVKFKLDEKLNWSLLKNITIFIKSILCRVPRIHLKKLKEDYIARCHYITENGGMHKKKRNWCICTQRKLFTQYGLYYKSLDNKRRNELIIWLKRYRRRR